MSFFKGTWYIKGYEAGSRQVNCYPIQRLSDIQDVGSFASKDRALIEKTKKYGLFETPRISGIRLQCDASMAISLREQMHARKYRLEPQSDGSVVICMKPEDETSVLRWILSEGGKIAVLDPPELRRKAIEAGKKIVEVNSLSSPAKKKTKNNDRS